MSDEGEEAERYARQISLFGAEGQEVLATARIAVLGLGGLGSHICQQLAYLGVKDFVIVDHDTVDPTNLNRLIGAGVGDIGAPKTVVAERLIKSIQSTASVVPIDELLPSRAVEQALAGVDLALGCFDNDYPRMLTTVITSRLKIPYIDAASGAHKDTAIFGGRVVVAGRTPGCLHCLEMLDQAEIRRAQMTDDQLEIEARIYGVPVASLRGTGPSVVTINGVVASLATTEAMVLLAGMRVPRKKLTYRMDLSTLNSSGDQPQYACPYCNSWLEPKG